MLAQAETESQRKSQSPERGTYRAKTDSVFPLGYPNQIL